jgi:hypothetical protein
MTSYPQAQLCELCRHALSSHWVAKDSIQPQNATQEEDAYKGDDYASSSDGFYEAPDWVTVVTEHDAPQALHAYQSPPHHSLTQLENSASQGCYLCMIFFDNARDEMRKLTAEKRAIISRLRSFIIARPSHDDSLDGEIVQLEITYYVDGIIKPDAFAMTIGIILYRLLRTYKIAVQ